MSENDDSGDKPAPADYMLTNQEAAAAERMIARRKKSTPSPRYKVSYPEGKAAINPDHPDQTCTHVLLADLLATGDSTLTEGLLVQLANVAQTDDKLTTADLNMMVATVKAIKPRDETEALLACQMASIHKAVIYAARRLNRADMLPQHDSAGNMLNKLARTFAVQVETLKRYRSTGEQSIRVQHVTVNDGGQAIVGQIQAGGGVPSKTEHQPHGPSEAGSRGPALLSNSEAFPPAMPRPSGQRLECVPMSRSTRRRANGDGQRPIPSWNADQGNDCGATDANGTGP